MSGPLPAARHGLRAAYISGVKTYNTQSFTVDGWHIFLSLICVSKSSTRQVDLVLGVTCNWGQTWHFWGWRGDFSSLICRIKGLTNLTLYLWRKHWFLKCTHSNSKMLISIIARCWSGMQWLKSGLQQAFCKWTGETHWNFFCPEII